jgi:two-component system chemotaxis sensor kinase CheA
VPRPAATQAAPTSPPAPEPAAQKSESVRVDVALLDKLMNLVGELVLARNQVLQHVGEDARDTAFVATSQRLNLITAELQEGVMKTRMQPINNIWGKFPRMVRHLASVCGKSVRMEMEGQDTELDRTILEAIKDPLTHIIRNSVDHGVELPEARLAAGKPAEGRLYLRAFHESGQVNMEIIDDGKGIDVEAVMVKAVERGLISVAEADRMSDRDLMQLVFHPGFSTAKAVTNVSGRGVGMDVVKTNIERIGGTVEIQSAAGVGTTLRIKIPLTLAIIPTLVVHSAGERFAVPQVSLIELVRLDGAAALRKIEHIHGAPVYRLRGNLLPLVYLNDILKIDGETGDAKTRLAARSGADATVNIVVLHAYDRQFGLVVDSIQDTAEIVVKPLGGLLKNLDVFAGATILGDGRVALIVDVLGVAQASSVLSEHRMNQPVRQETANRARDEVQVLLFRAGRRRLAVRLSEVARLEELDAATIEEAGGREVVQYRGGILPLARMCDVLGVDPVSRDEEDDLHHVIVYSADQGDMGVVVDEILDVVEEQLTVHPVGYGRGGVVGSAVVGGKVTDVVDLGVLLRVSDLARVGPESTSP